jgi:hypothetical protein
MQIGFSKVNITPPILTCSNGGMFHDANDFHLGVHDELFARAVVLRDGEQSAVIVSADLINLLKPSVLAIKNIVKEYCKIPSGNIILHATHQHSGPFSYRRRKGVRNDAYWTVVEQQIGGAVYMAQSALQDFLVGAGKSTLDYTLNRRILRDDGKVLYLSRHPGLEPNQSVDNEVGVVSFRKLDKRPCVTVINYSCHPLTVGFVPRLISADYPGAATRNIGKRLFGAAIYTNGACGDVHPKEHCEGFGAMEDLGQAIADKVLEILPFLEVSKGDALRLLCESVTLELIPEKMEGNEEIQQFRKGTTIDFEITVVALNDIAFIGIPCEYFVEFQLEIKRKSPFKHTYLLTNSNGYMGYVPTSLAYDQEGYEVESTKFQRGSGEIIRDKILEMLNKSAGGR